MIPWGVWHVFEILTNSVGLHKLKINCRSQHYRDVSCHSTSALRCTDSALGSPGHDHPELILEWLQILKVGWLIKTLFPPPPACPVPLPLPTPPPPQVHEFHLELQNEKKVSQEIWNWIGFLPLLCIPNNMGSFGKLSRRWYFAPRQTWTPTWPDCFSSEWAV